MSSSPISDAGAALFHVFDSDHSNASDTHEQVASTSAAAAPTAQGEEDAAGQTPTAPSLDKVPDDVLLEIWTHLDDPAALARTSKRFLVCSQDGFFRSRWLFSRYPLYEVIFQAIARPKLFDEALLERLINGGAVLSRNLVQLLHHRVHNPSTYTPQGIVNWGKSVSLCAYLAVVKKGIELYGANIPLKGADVDDWVFHSWLTNGSHAANAVVPPKIKELVSMGFTPLPIGISLNAGYDGRGAVTVQRSRDSATENALFKAPSLAPLMRANGYKTTFEGSLWLCRKIFSSFATNNQPVSNEDGSNQSHESIKSKLETLQTAGVLQISRTVASNVIMGLRPSIGVTDPAESPVEAIRAYDALMQLDREGLLGFDLVDIVKELALHFEKGAIDATMVPLLERLEKDFPQVDELCSLYVQAMFFKIEDEGPSHAAAIEDVLGRHKVTYESVMQACLRNGCRSTNPIEYAAFMIDDFDTEGFFQELIQAVLHQPYRGKMLRELDRLANRMSRGQVPGKVDFRAMLAKAVEEWAFTSAQIPAQHWRRRSAQHSTQCNPNLAVRSLLSYSYRAPVENHYRYAYVAAAEVEVDAAKVATSHDGLPGFTKFGTNASAKGKAREELDDNEVEDDVGVGAAAPMSDYDKTKLGEVQLARLQDVVERPVRRHFWNHPPPQPDAYSGGTQEQQELFKARRRNVKGPIAEDDEALAVVAVGILGPTSRAADIFLSHSIVNNNHELTKTLLLEGVPLTLEHFKIALKIGAELPDLLSHIKHGAPFKTSFHAPENEPEASWSYKSGLTTKLRDQCIAWSNENTWPRCFSVDLDEADLLRIERIADVRSRAVKRLLPARVAPSSASVVERSERDSEEPPTSASAASGAAELDSDSPNASAVVGAADDEPLSDPPDAEDALKADQVNAAPAPAVVPAEAAAVDDEDIQMQDPDASIAQRIKASRRKAVQVSYAESDRDDSGDSDSDGSEDEASEVDDGEAPNLIIMLNELPTVIAREERDLRITSTKLWAEQLELLRRPQIDAKAALSLAVDGGHFAATYHGRFTDADDKVADLIPALKEFVVALETAKPAPRGDSVGGELSAIWQELDQAETKPQLEQIKALVARKLKGKKLYKQMRRRAFRKSPYGTRHRPWSKRYKRRDNKELNDMEHLFDDSADEDFVASIVPIKISSSDIDSDSNEESEAESDAETEVKSESELSDAEPMPKRAKTGRNTASAKPKGTSMKSAKPNGKRKATSAAAKGKGRKRARSSSSSEEESSSSDSDNEVAAVSNTQVGSSSKMQAMASGSGSGSNGGIASPADDDAEQEESTHPVYSHHLFNDEEFQGVLAAIRADGLSDEAAETLYLEELLDMELADSEEEEEEA